MTQKCEGGVPLKWEACEVCGAGQDDLCAVSAGRMSAADAASSLRRRTGGVRVSGMSDLVTRLQCLAEDDSSHYPAVAKKLCAEAAARIQEMEGLVKGSVAAPLPIPQRSRRRAMSDVAKRIRIAAYEAWKPFGKPVPYDLCREAADRIEELEKAVRRASDKATHEVDVGEEALFCPLCGYLEKSDE